MDFHEAFSSISIREDLDQAFEGVSVDRVVLHKRSGEVTIHISARRPIRYKLLAAMRQNLQQQLFHQNGNKIRFEERYDLPSLYTPANLFDTIRESLVAELRENSIIAGRLLDTASVVFREDADETSGRKDTVCQLTVPDTSLNRERLPEIAAWLRQIYEVRYSMPIRTELIYERVRETENISRRDREMAEKMGYQGAEIVSIEEARADSLSIAERQEKRAAADRKRNGAKGISAEEAAAAARKGRGEDPKPAPAPAARNQDKATKDGERKFYRHKLPDDPDIFYGRPFEGEITKLSEIQGEVGEVVVRGMITRLELKEIRNEKTIVLFDITDFSDSITSKIFVKNENLPPIKEKMSVGAFIRLKGIAMMDSFEKEITIGSVQGIKTIPDFRAKRMDKSEEKRVELHLHTIMSDMDACVNPGPLLKTLKDWGHSAVAVTDHGVVQAFTELYHAMDKAKMPPDFKLIYGVEGYLVDDINVIVRNEAGQKLTDPAVVFDIETTGFGVNKDRITEIGAVKVKDGEIVERFSTFVNPEMPIPERVSKLTHITDDMVADAPTIESVLPDFLKFCEGCFLVAHNASFDTSFIYENMRRQGIEGTFTIADTMSMTRVLVPGLKNYRLETMCEAVGATLHDHHRAVNDAEATADAYLRLCKLAVNKFGDDSLKTLNDNSKIGTEAIKRMRPYHVIILAKNDLGRINLYKLVSESHLTYFSRYPRIPKSLLEENREGLIIGSACEAGELYQAILRQHGQDEIARIAEFYDYFEIQPLGNNRFMIDDPDNTDINSDEDLIAINRQIVNLGKEYNKPVIATGDVHFLNPEDEMYRRILLNAKGFKDADRQPPLYLRTTEEMLDEFRYLGAEKAREVVITNTNLIADMIEPIIPVRPDKCPPVIEDSDTTLRRICYDRAHELYGPNLPKQVEDRLEHELNSIIKNGFAVMYIIAQKLVWKSNEDGYLVGSRGSVGSSFAAFTSGITEVNSLAAHYRCENCFYVDFDSDEVKAYAGRSGCDMPDKLCPVCGKPLIKDGHDIPFETFLGFNGDKEPDIDLNFSGEYQSKSHAYTEVIFGEGQTFRAGTIGALADKTAYGYVLKYLEERELTMRKAEITRVAAGCIGVRRTTGQHPGGIVVLPFGEDIYSFTPVQHPANDMTTDTVTTHFDYHSIDHNLLKLDILGHDDPTMIRMLEDITGLDAKAVRLDDEKVLSLFTGLDALGIKPEDIDGCDLGSYGVPEFGTKFVMQMLRDTKPQNFSELVRISGLSHGTDVWLNNAQTLIAEGKCTIGTAICTRDDIMTYLINKGLDNGHAFKIMESVRKGRGLQDWMEKEMVEYGVPDWYIWSCKKIKYMFPKAHAAAYVMMGFRIAWFKVYQPLAYYAAFFSIRATAFDYEKMCQGKRRLDAEVAAIKAKGDQASNKEKDQIDDMHIVQEMYARGFDFVPIDIYRAKAKHFQIVEDNGVKKLMPSLNAIDGMGDKSAQQIEEAVKDGPFLSKEDFKTRGKVSQTTVDKMSDMGLLEGLPETNQISLMDLFAPT